MSRKIPSNSALQVFEAAARHGSFARAAEELARPEGAVSRQNGRLEAFLAARSSSESATGCGWRRTVRATRRRFARFWIGSHGTACT